MYIIYEVSAFPAMINQPATLLEPRAFEARPEGNTFFFRNFPSFFPFRSQISRIFEPLPSILSFDVSNNSSRFL